MQNPFDDLHKQTLNLPRTDLLKLCERNLDMRKRICENEKFLKLWFLKYFPIIYFWKPPEVSLVNWAGFKHLLNSKTQDLFHHILTIDNSHVLERNVMDYLLVKSKKIKNERRFTIYTLDFDSTLKISKYANFTKRYEPKKILHVKWFNKYFYLTFDNSLYNFKTGLVERNVTKADGYKVDWIYLKDGKLYSNILNVVPTNVIDFYYNGSFTVYYLKTDGKIYMNEDEYISDENKQNFVYSNVKKLVYPYVLLNDNTLKNLKNHKLIAENVLDVIPSPNFLLTRPLVITKDGSYIYFENKKYPLDMELIYNEQAKYLDLEKPQGLSQTWEPKFKFKLI